MRRPIKKDYMTIIHDYRKALEIKYAPRRNDFNNDYHFRIMTDININFNTTWRMVRKPIFKNFFSSLALQVSDMMPEYDIIFYLHGGGFLANTSEAHSDYLRK
jgi:hypothetical protein